MLTLLQQCKTTCKSGACTACKDTDQDLDGHYTPDSNCRKPADDCNDANPAVHGKAKEICDGIDNDCDGLIDEGLTFDRDNDGYSAPNSCAGTKDDCNDRNAAINPGAEEICDRYDNDCDGLKNEGLSSDEDQDGYTSIGSCEGKKNDCNDHNSSVYPRAKELCDDIDNDCDGMIDDGLTFDRDGDGYSAPNSCHGTKNDCNDRKTAINPGADEVCDKIDNNCDGQVNEGLTFDVDGDGYTSVDSCSGTKNDCNDSNASVYPGAAEVCSNNLDEDCSGADILCEDVCVDSDGGDMSSVYGVVSLKGKTYPDRCQNANYLVEYYCYKNSPKMKLVRCSCSGGKCS